MCGSLGRHTEAHSGFWTRPPGLLASAATFSFPPRHPLRDLPASPGSPEPPQTPSGWRAWHRRSHPRQPGQSRCHLRMAPGESESERPAGARRAPEPGAEHRLPAPTPSLASNQTWICRVIHNLTLQKVCRAAGGLPGVCGFERGEEFPHRLRVG